MASRVSPAGEQAVIQRCWWWPQAPSSALNPPQHPLTQTNSSLEFLTIAGRSDGLETGATRGGLWQSGARHLLVLLFSCFCCWAISDFKSVESPQLTLSLSTTGLDDGVGVVAWWHGCGLRVTMRLSGVAAVLRGQLRRQNCTVVSQCLAWSELPLLPFPLAAAQCTCCCYCCCWSAGGSRLPQLVLEGIRSQSLGNRQAAPTRSHSFPAPLRCPPPRAVPTGSHSLTPEPLPRPWVAISTTLRVLASVVDRPGY